MYVKLGCSVIINVNEFFSVHQMAASLHEMTALKKILIFSIYVQINMNKSSATGQ